MQRNGRGEAQCIENGDAPTRRARGSGAELTDALQVGAFRSRWLAAWLAPALAARATAVPVYRFFNNLTGTHFYTMSTIERDIVLSRWPQFLYEGTGVLCVPDAGARHQAGLPLLRHGHQHALLHAVGSRARPVHRDVPTYIFEGPFSTHPLRADTARAALYRFYNTQTHARFYTDSADRARPVLRIYPWFQLEGIGFYVFTSLTPPGGTDDSALKVSLAVQPTSAQRQR